MMDKNGLGQWVILVVWNYAFSFLQCLDAVYYATGRASGP